MACCTVGIVYKNSPAAAAGLQKGDVVLQWGMMQKGRSLAQRFGFQPDLQAGGSGHGDALIASTRYVDVPSSVSPIVRAFVGMPIDVIVRRGEAECLRLRLVPERWSGQGLLGCILK